MTYNKMYILNDYIVGALLGVHKPSKIFQNLMSVYEISSYSDNFSFVWYLLIKKQIHVEYAFLNV